MKELLGHFTATDEFVPWAQQPFTIDNRNMATDGHTMISIPKIAEYEGIGEEKEAATRAYFSGQNMKAEILTADIKTAIESIKSFVEKVKVKKECPECEGLGLVEWSYKKCIGDFACPVCNGNGEVTTGATEDVVRYEDTLLQIGEHLFKRSVVAKLLFAAEHLNAEKVYLVKQGKTLGGSVFEIKEVLVLMMPSIDNHREIIIIKTKQQ
jgi:excinuclease UvrABC ATPase subunit